MGANRRQFLFNEIIKADSTKNTEDVFNGDIEETYWNMVNAGTIPTSSSSVLNNYASKVPVQSLPVWARKRTLSQLNQSPARILCIGDSTTAGIYSDSYTTATGSTNQGGPNSWPSQLASRLNAMGISSDYSMCIPGHPGNADSRFVFTSGWGYSGAGVGPGAAANVTSGNVNEVITVTPGIVADRYKIYYFGDPGIGSVSVTATGGAATPINMANATPGIYSAVVSASAASASNTVAITNTAGTIYVVGIESYNSANTNKVRVMNAGVGGSKSIDWANDVNANKFGGRAFLKAVAPDLTIISLGINDGSVSTSTATVLSAVQTLAADAKLTGDVLIMSAFPHNTTSILDSYNNAFKNAGYPYIDIQNRWGYAGQSMQFVTTDNTHPNAIGYGDIATAVAQIIGLT